MSDLNERRSRELASRLAGAFSQLRDSATEAAAELAELGFLLADRETVAEREALMSLDEAGAREAQRRAEQAISRSQRPAEPHP